MKKHRPTTWIVLTIAEPFPLAAGTESPCYAAGSRWYYMLDQRPHAENVAAAQRAKGYTVTLSEETR